jgi:large subunit ribosomal protein L37Ae
MPKTKKVKAAGRFGTRYGRRVRTKIAEVETPQRKKQECLFCNGIAKRLSKGIWKCKKCNKKFASHTYTLPKKEE